MTKSTQKDFEKVISLLRFPLIIGIVLIHSTLKGGEEAPIYTFLHNVFSNLLVAPCVPAFFFISGFLFFYKVESFDNGVYLNKIKRRVKTLLIPYLFWNTLVLFYYFIGHVCFPNVISTDNCNVLQYSLLDFVRSYWDNPGGFPICFQFWYLRDLIVLCVLTPVIYMLTKVLSKYVIALYVLLYVLLDKPGILGSASSLFAFGCYFSIWNMDVMELCRKCKWVFMTVFISSLFYQLFFEGNGYANKLMVLSGIAVFFYCADVYRKHVERKESILDRYTFFIYGFHGFPIVLLTTTILPRLFGYSDFMYVVQYVLAPVIIIAISVVLYMFLYRACPKFLSMINGGRV